MQASGVIEAASRAARKPILFLQQVSAEGPGALAEVLGECGIPWSVRRLDLRDPLPTDLNGFAALVVLGGPMNVEDAEAVPYLEGERRLLEKAIEQDFPTIGICLGSQLLAAAAGARVVKGPAPEIGWFDVRLGPGGREDPAFARLDDSFTAFHWHAQTFDLPVGATHLASSERYPNQAFRLGDNVYGFQFHPEITASMVAHWTKLYSSDLESDPDAASRLARETDRLQDGSRQRLRRLVGPLFSKIGVLRSGEGPVVNRIVG